MFDFSNARQVAAKRRARRHASGATRLFLEWLEDRRMLASDPNVNLIVSGDDWKYLDDGSDQGTAWRAVAFDDATWLSGPSELGYNDGSEPAEATVIGFGPDSANKYVTSYFRRKFQVNQPIQIGVLAAQILRDDAVAVYLNGEEVIRDVTFPGTLGDNAVTFGTRPNAAVDEALGYVSFPLNPAKLVAGENTIAVEVHQATADSSDVSMDIRLIAGRTKFVVTNTADSGTGSLRQAIADCAGNTGNPHVVSFEIPGGGVRQIVLNSPLQNLTDAVTYTVPAGTEVQIGTNAPNATTLGQSGNTTKTGDGTLTVGGNFNRTINTQLKVDGGIMQILSDPNPTGTLRLTVNVNAGGQLRMGSNQSLAALNVNAGGKAWMTPGAHLMLTNALTVNATGQFDLGDNDVIVQATAATRAAVFNNVTSWLATGAAGLNWNGNGVMSSSAATDPSLLTAVGVMKNDNGQGGVFYPTFSGKTVNVNSILLKYTYYGDADLSGVVDGTDYALVDNGFNTLLSGWFNGDFDHSAPIGGTDYALIDNAFNAAGPPLAAVGDIPGVPAVTPPSHRPDASDRPIGIAPAALAAALGDWTFAVEDGFGQPTRRRR